MAFRSPPNKGIVLYPAVFHLRCSTEMRDAILGHGGAGWVRSIVKANMGEPFTAPGRELPATPSITPKRSRRRVSLDKRRKGTVK